MVINAPASFDNELKEMREVTKVMTDLTESNELSFAAVFVTKQNDIDDIIEVIAKNLIGDAIFWFCYPKGSSKNYKCDFKRDTGWKSVATFNLEPVRMVSIDNDWSALRFRKVEYIKKITRRESFALTAEAKKRTTQKGK